MKLILLFFDSRIGEVDSSALWPRDLFWLLKTHEEVWNVFMWLNFILSSCLCCHKKNPPSPMLCQIIPWLIQNEIWSSYYPLTWAQDQTTPPEITPSNYPQTHKQAKKCSQSTDVELILVLLWKQKSTS